MIPVVEAFVAASSIIVGFACIFFRANGDVGLIALSIVGGGNLAVLAAVRMKKSGVR